MIDVNTILDDERTSFGFSYEDVTNIDDYCSRHIYLHDEICEITANYVINRILSYNNDDKNIPESERKPIIFYCTSSGGSVDDGMGIINIIEQSITPIYTVNLAYQCSMGFLIGLAGKKRYAMPNAKFLMHDGTSVAIGASSKILDSIKFEEQREKRIKEFVLNHSNLNQKQYDEIYRVELYTFADKAKEYGFIDYIIGVDCDLGEVL